MNLFSVKNKQKNKKKQNSIWEKCYKLKWVSEQELRKHVHCCICFQILQNWRYNSALEIREQLKKDNWKEKLLKEKNEMFFITLQHQQSLFGVGSVSLLVWGWWSTESWSHWCLWRAYPEEEHVKFLRVNKTFLTYIHLSTVKTCVLPYRLRS